MAVSAETENELVILVAQNATWMSDYAATVATALGDDRSSIVVRNGEGPDTRGPEVTDVLIGLGTWAATSAAWDVTKALAAQVRSRLAARMATEVPPLDEGEAIARACWLVVQRYGEDEGALTVDAVDTDIDGGVQVVVTGEWEYTCWLELRDGLVVTARIIRSRPR
ncbi:hypothetical protein ACWIGW_34945 [Nocardia brasiliensis]